MDLQWIAAAAIGGLGVSLAVLHQIKTLITDAERARRAAAVHSARASFALEGFKPSAADLLHEQRFIDGEIDLIDMDQQIEGRVSDE